MAIFGQRFVGLGDDVLFFFISRDVVDIFRNDARFFIDAAVRGFNEAEFVDFTEAGRDEIKPMFGPSGVSTGTYGRSGNDGRRGLRTLRVHGTDRQDRGRSDGVCA